nr:MBL fold metallo-hydrolase [Schaalia suimastitidis]
MELRVIGCTGSMSGPASAASSYLVRAYGHDPLRGRDRWWNIVLDMGPGSFGGLWRHIDPRDLDAVLFSHCHADHIGDVISLHVHRRWGPAQGLPPILLVGPAGLEQRVRQIDGVDEAEDYSGEFRFATFVDAHSFAVGPLTITPARGWHSVDSFGVRIDGPGAKGQVSLFYTGDTDECDSIVEGARGVDLLLCEAGFMATDEVRGIHLDGARAGRVASRADVTSLLLTHIQPWNDPQQVCAEARTTWTGPLGVVRTDAIYEVGVGFSA